jgi:hypothetical protein
MHTGPMKDSDGDFKPGCGQKHKCRKCDAVEATCEEWESSCGGYEDYRYTCGACGYVWWVDGIDS